MGLGNECSKGGGPCRGNEGGMDTKQRLPPSRPQDFEGLRGTAGSVVLGARREGAKNQMNVWSTVPPQGWRMRSFTSPVHVVLSHAPVGPGRRYYRRKIPISIGGSTNQGRNPTPQKLNSGYTETVVVTSLRRTCEIDLGETVTQSALLLHPGPQAP